MVHVKILLDLPTDTVETIRLKEQWENEGGAALKSTSNKWITESQLPFSPGDHFKVAGGHIEQIGNQTYYIVELEPLEAGIHQIT